MITIEKRLDLPDTYPLERIGALEDLLFFDIETTGFSGDRSHLYLIGCTYYQDGSWNLIQWFADTQEAEPELLHSFFSFLKNYRILVHFNGDGFDIPYLLKRCRHFDLPYDFSAVTSVDIYRRIKPYRKLLSLESMKQKSIEQFLGVSRKDQYSGGELISVYEKYLMTHEQSLYDDLILHNEDDLKGMPAILPILNYPDFFAQNLTLSSQQVLAETDFYGTRRHLLRLVCKGDCTIPVPIEYIIDPVACDLEGNELTLTIDLYEGTLKHFYANYRDYYFLPEQDTALHKSLLSLAGSSARAKATARTCYTAQKDCFVPQFEVLWEPAFKKEPKDKLSYATLSDVQLSDPHAFSSYLNQILHHLGIR